MNKVAFQVSLPVAILREGEQFVAYTPALDLSTSGDTYEEAKKRFDEAAGIFFEETIQMGTLDEVLLELGWKKANNAWQPPVIVSQEQQTVQVPFHA